LSPERVRYTFTGTENGMAFDAGNRVWQIAESVGKMGECVLSPLTSFRTLYIDFDLYSDFIMHAINVLDMDNTDLAYTRDEKEFFTAWFLIPAK
jgi:hypothetical protein